MTEPSLEHIHNFLNLSESIATAGQPTAAQFASIRDAGYRVVINLALPSSTNALANELSIVEAQGMEYVHIPVSWDNPTLQDFNQFVQVMQARADQPVFVHCAMNMRVSAFVYLYRRIYQGIDDATARRDLNQIWTPNDRWQAFIDHVLQHFL